MDAQCQLTHRLMWSRRSELDQIRRKKRRLNISFSEVEKKQDLEFT